MAKKSKKKNKKIKKIKTKETRIEEVKLIKDKLTSLGLSEEHEGIPEIFKILKDFENDGFSNSGKIKLVGLQRVAHFILTNKPHVESTLCLKYNPDV